MTKTFEKAFRIHVLLLLIRLPFSFFEDCDSVSGARVLASVIVALFFLYFYFICVPTHLLKHVGLQGMWPTSEKPSLTRPAGSNFSTTKCLA